MRTSTIFVAAFLTAPLAQAEIYKCVIGGRTVFSQTPCAPDAVEVKPKVVQPTAEDVARQQAVTASLEAAAGRMAHDRRLAEIERQLADLDVDEARVQEARRLELRRLEVTGGLARNNLAGATWQQGLAMEMQAVNARFDSELAVIQSRREALLQERERLLAPTGP